MLERDAVSKRDDPDFRKKARDHMPDDGGVLPERFPAMFKGSIAMQRMQASSDDDVDLWKAQVHRQETTQKREACLLFADLIERDYTTLVDDKPMTLDEAADFLGCSKRTLERRLEVGRIAAIPFGDERGRRVMLSELHRFLRQ